MMEVMRGARHAITRWAILEPSRRSRLDNTLVIYIQATTASAEGDRRPAQRDDLLNESRRFQDCCAAGRARGAHYNHYHRLGPRMDTVPVTKQVACIRGTATACHLVRADQEHGASDQFHHVIDIARHPRGCGAGSPS